MAYGRYHIFVLERRGKRKGKSSRGEASQTSLPKKKETTCEDILSCNFIYILLFNISSHVQL